MSQVHVRVASLLLLLIISKNIEGEELPCDNKVTKLYKCQNGKCIARSNFCDKVNECSDGSDEFTNTSLIDGIMCQYRSNTDPVNKICVLPNVYKCDHEIDCIGGSDECDCAHTFKCDNGDCVLKVSFCDNANPRYGCADGTDEREFNRTSGEGFQCPVTRTHLKKICVLPDPYVCDGTSDCDFGIDECFCDFSAGGKKGLPLNNVYSNEKCFRCLDGSLVIPNIHVCDGIVHCEDLSDECLCPGRSGHDRPAICDSICKGPDCDCPSQLKCLPKLTSTTMNPHFTLPAEISKTVCIDHTSICDDVFDCENQLDEIFCPLDKATFLCYDGSRKIKQHQFCNGPKDCDDGSDELYCHELTDYFCEEYRIYFNVADWNNVSKNDAFLPPGVTLEFDRPFFTKKCDGIPLCPALDDECGIGCENEEEFCKYVTRGLRCPVSGSLIIGMQVCDGKPNCNDTRPDLSVDEFDCPGRFYCLNMGVPRLPIHIPMEEKCDGKTNCDDISDELNCSKTTHFYCEDEGSTLFVPFSRVCDGRMDCKEGYDECQNCNPSPFSSDEKLISSRVLIVFLWIIGITAVVGNTTVIVYQIINLVKPTGTPSPVAISNRMILLNLAASDLLVGIYLVSLGVKDASVSEYCLLDQEWRSSSTCSALGSLALVGTETSVFILLIMTAYKLYHVVRPFKAQKIFNVGISIGVAWIISFVLAFAPLAKSAQDYFVSCVWFPSHHFIGLVCRKDLQKFTRDLVLFEGGNKTFSNAIQDGYTWTNMFSAMEKLNSSYVPERYFGYYSAHSVCLPRLFPDPNSDEVWGYSLFLILVNFFAFLFILISYICIYRITMKRNAQNAQNIRSEDHANALQRKVTRIVLTDFCCWMPICIMAFIKFSGVHISDESYAVTAIILLPINSAMNPFLYSDILDIIWDKLLPVRKRFNETLCGTKPAQKMEDRRDKQKNKTPLGANSSCETRSTGPTTGQPLQHTNYNKNMESDIQKSEVGMNEYSTIQEVSDMNTKL